MLFVYQSVTTSVIIEKITFNKKVQTLELIFHLLNLHKKSLFPTNSVILFSASSGSKNFPLADIENSKIPILIIDEHSAVDFVAALVE